MKFRTVLAITAVILASEVTLAHAQYGGPPFAAQRGRYRSVHGIFRDKERVRWGNGLTPQGAAFLTVAVQEFAPAVNSLITGGISTGGGGGSKPDVDTKGGASDDGMQPTMSLDELHRSMDSMMKAAGQVDTKSASRSSKSDTRSRGGNATASAATLDQNLAQFVRDQQDIVAKAKANAALGAQIKVDLDKDIKDRQAIASKLDMLLKKLDALLKVE